MGTIDTLIGLPLIGPLRGLQWIARRIAEEAERELADPARIEAALLTLERQLEAGEIDEATHEAREAELLAQLDDAATPAPDTEETPA
jgi:hypothetical protein